MSAKAARILHHQLLWSEYLIILSYLTLRELYASIGQSCRDGFVVYLRERSSRSCSHEYKSCTLYRFLPRYSPKEQILLVSYPRSGNSFLRRLLEKWTGYITCSDSRTNRHLTSALLQCGFSGEGIVDKSAWIIKSHYPERMGYIKFNVKKVILLVRNPYDSIESNFHMGMTNTHDRNLSTASFARLKEVWDAFVAHEALVWSRFHIFWLTKQLKGEVSMCVIRYEDLLENIVDTRKIILSYIHNDDTSSAVEITDTSCITGYKPKTGGIGKGLKILSTSQIDTVKECTQPLLSKFGYNVNPAGISLSGMQVDRDYANMGTRSGIQQTDGISVNESFTIRDADDRFGRDITCLRKQFTVNDTIPFELI